MIQFFQCSDDTEKTISIVEAAKTLNAACPISDGQAEFGVFFDGGQKHAKNNGTINPAMRSTSCHMKTYQQSIPIAVALVACVSPLG